MMPELLPVEIATDTHRFFGPLAAHLTGRRIIDSLNDERLRCLRLEPARVRSNLGLFQRETDWADVQKDSLVFVAPARDAGPVNPEYRVEKTSRKVTMLAGPYEIDANWHAPTDLHVEASLLMHVRSFFIVTDAVIKRGDSIEAWPLLAIRRGAVHGVWDTAGVA